MDLGHQVALPKKLFMIKGDFCQKIFDDRMCFPSPTTNYVVEDLSMHMTLK